ncbi:MAG: CDP-glycerol glycerophosphotransferase family protein, partial [Helicobacter sp.]|nr:CDP-glycerol glycerophosphotransferase family protein [Helicobacter sp.]
SYVENFLKQPRAIEIFKEILENDIGIILRLHPNLKEEQMAKYKEQIDILSEYEKFIIDSSKSYFNEYFYKSFALLSDESSMGVSYPFLTCKPSIIFMPDKRKQGVSIEGVHLYDKRVNIMLESLENLQSILKDILKRDYTESIKTFRDKQMFNSLKSSRYIAEFIKKQIKD